MQYAKLQICCFLVIVYLNIIYIKATLNKKIPCNKYYDLLMLLSPIAVFFDGLTAITVNYLDTIPLIWNNIFHLLFFISMVLVLYAAFLYIIDKTIEIPKKLIYKILISLPTIISIILICVFIPKLEYIIGTHTNYSMGVSVIASYASIIIHFVFILFLIIYKFKNIEKRKASTIIISLTISICIFPINNNTWNVFFFGGSFN